MESLFRTLYILDGASRFRRFLSFDWGLWNISKTLHQITRILYDEPTCSGHVHVYSRGTNFIVLRIHTGPYPSMLASDRAKKLLSSYHLCLQGRCSNRRHLISFRSCYRVHSNPTTGHSHSHGRQQKEINGTRQRPSQARFSHCAISSGTSVVREGCSIFLES